MRHFVTHRQHLHHAALLWTLGGVILCLRGLLWLATDAATHRWLLALLPLAVLLGSLKGVALLGKTARDGIERIHRLPARSPVWHLMSPAMYLLLGGMIGLGIACRWAGAHWHLFGVLGGLYLAIGVALLTGSRAFWQAR